MSARRHPKEQRHWQWTGAVWGSEATTFPAETNKTQQRYIPGRSLIVPCGSCSNVMSPVCSLTIILHTQNQLLYDIIPGLAVPPTLTPYCNITDDH